MSNRFVCLDNPRSEPGGTIAVVDATTFVILSKATYHRAFMDVMTIVPGPIGQTALRTNMLPENRAARSLSFFNSPALQ